MYDRGKHKCLDCKHCDIEHMKCFPNSKDCRSEYNLNENDLKTENYCDFFEWKTNWKTN